LLIFDCIFLKSNAIFEELKYIFSLLINFVLDNATIIR